MSLGARRRTVLAAMVLSAMLTLGPPGPADGLAEPASRATVRSRRPVAPLTRPATTSTGPTQPATAPGSLEDCQRLYQRGEYAAAIDGYRRLAHGPPQRLKAAIGLAQACAMAGRYQEALEALKAASAEGAADRDWRAAMAELLYAVGRYDEALSHAAAANDASPAWAPAIFLRGWLLETLGRKKQAIEVYKSMSATLRDEGYRRDARSLVALGQIMDRYAILTGQRASEQAANILHNYFQEAYLKADRSYWPANVAAGLFLLSKHRPEQAQQEFALAAKLNPNIPDVYAALGAIHVAKYEFEPCLQHVDRALKINPNHADALLVKAACLMQWRKFDDVAGVIEKVLAVNPNHLEALSLMAALYARLGEQAKAEPYIQRIGKINASYAGLPNALGEWLAAARQFDQAEKHYLRAIELAPELAEPVTNLGLLYMQTGDEDKALAVLEKAHKIDDFRADVVNYLNLLRRMANYQVSQTEHFIVKVDGKHDAILLDQVAEYMERIHKELAKDFEHAPPHRTIVEIFPTHADFSVRITGRGWIGTIGACTGRVIALVAPNIERSQFGTHNWATVLRHEYAHAVTLSATRNRIPHWFTEACAVWQQPDRQNYQNVRTLVDATRQGRLFSIKELDWGFIRPRRAGDRGLAYAQAEWTMEYIIQTRGYETIPRMLRAFGDGASQADVFAKVVGMPEKDFDAAFRKWAVETVRKWGFNPDPPPDLAKAEKAARDSPGDADAQAALAVALYYRGNMPAAEAAARKALTLSHDHVRALSVLAASLAEQKKHDEAAEVARRLEGLDHTTSFAPKVLAQCAVAKGRWAEAVAALELLQQRQPLDPYSYTQLALIYVQLGQPEKALPNLIHLHRHTMRDPQYARQIAEIYRAMKRNDDALEYFREVTYINPYQPNAYEAMAAIHRDEGRYDQAVEAIEKVCLIQPDSAEAWAKTAMLRLLAGRQARDRDKLLKARQAAEKAIAIDPDSQARQVLERIDEALAKLGSGA